MSNPVVYVKTPGGRSVLEAGLARMSQCFSDCDTPIVNFSGGKDSTVLLFLASVIAERQNRDFYILHGDEEIVDPDTLAYCHRVVASNNPRLHFRWSCLPVRHTLGGTGRTHWYTWDPREEAVWYRRPPKMAITLADYDLDFEEWKTRDNHLSHANYTIFDPETYGRLGVLAAVRASESQNRTRAHLVSGTWFFEHLPRNNRFFAKPIYDWNATDIWKCIKDHKLDYSRFYDRMWKCGVGLRNQRVGSLGNVASVGQMKVWQEIYPMEYDRASRRLPELKAMANYGRTSLFQRGSYKPEGLTWMEWCFVILAQLPEEDQKYWHTEIKGMLRRWRDKYDSPMPDKALVVHNAGTSHTVGSWQKIVSIVSKNDRIMGASRDIFI